MKNTMVSLALNGAAALLMVGVLLRLVHHHRRTKRQQDELLNELMPGLAPGQRWFRINLSRQAAFARRMKFLAFESKGLLVEHGDELRAVALLPGGERLDRCFPKDSLRWVGNAGIAAGNLHWMSLGSGDATLMITADTGFSALASREATADMVRALTPQQPLSELARHDFALEKHAATRVAMGVMLALFVYLLADLALNEHELLNRSFELWLRPLALLLALPVYPLLARRGVPGREATWLAVFMGIMLSGASVPLAMRVDQWLSPGPVATPYRLQWDARLVPVEPGPPAVQLRNVRAYWEQFDPGTEHSLDILHGPLGLWQLDRSRLNAVTRDWYRRGDAATPAASRPASTGPAPTR
ncbi:MAG TPA: hypothetical protein VIN03_19320 [Roseateles sp.]